MRLKMSTVDTYDDYKIPYRRARAWPSGCIGRVHTRAKLSRIQWQYTKYFVCMIPLLLRAFGLKATRPSTRDDGYIEYKYIVSKTIKFLNKMLLLARSV